MAEPAAEESSEGDGEDDGEEEHDGAGVDDADLEGFHGFGGFDWGDGGADDEPLDDVGDHQEIDE